MKHLLYSITLILFLVSCSDNKYEKLMTDYIHEGIKHDLKVKYSKFELSDITVQDSINILNEIYEKEKAQRLKSIESSITTAQQDIERYEERLRSNENDVNALFLLPKSKGKLEKVENELEQAKQWRADYLDKYDSSNPNEVLAKKAEIQFSYDHSLLKTRSEESGIVIMNLDATKVIKYIPNK